MEIRDAVRDTTPPKPQLTIADLSAGEVFSWTDYDNLGLLVRTDEGYVYLDRGIVRISTTNGGDDEVQREPGYFQRTEE